MHTFSLRFEAVFLIGFSVKIEEDKARQAVFLTPLNPFGKELEEENPHFDYTVSQKAPDETKWKRNQDALFWVRLKEAQDQG